MESVAYVWQMKNWLGCPEGMTSAGRQGHLVGSVCKLLWPSLWILWFFSGRELYDHPSIM